MIFLSAAIGCLGCLQNNAFGDTFSIRLMLPKQVKTEGRMRCYLVQTDHPPSGSAWRKRSCKAVEIVL
jgi:hypothetical protein